MSGRDDRSWAVAVRNPVKDPDAVVDPDVRAQTLRSITASPYPTYRARRATWSPTTFLAALMALVVAGSVLFAITRGGGGLPGAATALANIIESKDTIVHVVSNGPDVPNAAEGDSDIVREEQWLTFDQRRRSISRILTTYADGTFEDYRSVLTPRRYRWMVYRSKGNTLVINPWTAVRTKKVQPGRMLLRQAEAYASAVKNGVARLDGETEVNGVPAYRIVPKDTKAGVSAWYIARDAKDPRLLRVEQRCGGTKAKPQCPVTTYETFETINDRRVLQLPKRPGQKVLRLSAKQRPR